MTERLAVAARFDVPNVNGMCQRFLRSGDRRTRANLRPPEE